MELRRINAIDKYWGDDELTSNGLRECMERGAEAIGWNDKRRQYANQAGSIRRGVGMATGTWSSRVGPSSAVVKLFPDGSAKVYAGVTDVGTGAKTTMCMLAAEALGVPLQTVSIVSGDTDLAPYSVGESGSRTTGFTGTAVIQAAKNVREQLLDQAASRLKVPRESLDLRDGKLVSTAAEGERWNISEVTGRNVDALTSAITTNPPSSGKARSGFGAHFAEVEVDRDTGKVRVLRYVATQDGGTIINPLTAASQIKGAVIQGIGMALREELLWDRHAGIPVNNHYHGAKVLIHPEVPEVEVIFVNPGEDEGPFGAKSVGELPIVPVVAAVANAIFHASGARIRELPITPDKLLTAFRPGVGPARG
jgi:xanthine dehydrogenase molybdenum-binding subunit